MINPIELQIDCLQWLLAWLDEAIYEERRGLEPFMRGFSDEIEAMQTVEDDAYATLKELRAQLKQSLKEVNHGQILGGGNG